MPGKATIAAIEARLDHLIQDLEVHVPELIGLQLDLARNATREATKQRAGAKCLDWYVEAIAMKAKLAIPEHDEDAQDKAIKVLVVNSSELEAAKARAQQIYQESTRQLKK